MNADERFDGNLSAWLHERAGQGSPAYLDDILGRTHRTRQRPAWTFFERWIPMDLTTRANAFAPPRLGRALLVVALIAILLVAAVAFIGSQRRPLPAPFGPAANGLITYSDKGDIYVADADGSDPRLVVGGATNDVGPMYSPDGTQLAFLREVGNRTLQLEVSGPSGDAPRALAGAAYVDPDWWDWSPDGQSLVVQHLVDGRKSLTIVPVTGSGTIHDLAIGDLDAETPTWRPPDGGEIVFRGQARDGIHTALYAIGADGTGLRAISPVVADAGAYESLRFSPDGRLVAYEMPVENGVRSHILDLASRDDRLIGEDPASPYQVGPKFSPDGSQVMYLQFAVNRPSRVMIVPVDRSAGPRQVAELSVNGDFFAEFSPDGSKALIFDRRSNGSRIVDIASGDTVGAPSMDDWSTWQRLALPGS